MKRITALCVALLLTVSCFSCGNAVNSSEVRSTGAGFVFETNQQLIDSGIIGSTKEIPYESLIENGLVQFGLEDFIDPKNPLQLESGSHENAEVARPLKFAVVSGEGMVEQINIWRFPIVDNGICIGFANIDCREGETGITNCSGGKDISDGINNAIEKGSFAIFLTGSTLDVYGVYEDNTFINLAGTTPYNGNLTFDDINQGYNLVTPDSLNDIIVTVDERLSEDEYEQQIKQIYEKEIAERS